MPTPTNFSPAQLESIHQSVEKWLQFACRTTSLEPPKTTQTLRFLYEKMMKKPLPKRVLIFESPAECQIALQQITATPICLSQPFQLIHRRFKKEVESEFSFSSAIEVYGYFYERFRSHFEGQKQSDSQSDLQDSLHALNLRYFPPTWCNERWSELCQYGYYDCVLSHFFMEKKAKFELFYEWMNILPELHQCWLYDQVAVVCNFPRLTTSSKVTIANSLLN